MATVFNTQRGVIVSTRHGDTPHGLSRLFPTGILVRCASPWMRVTFASVVYSSRMQQGRCLLTCRMLPTATWRCHLTAIMWAFARAQWAPCKERTYSAWRPDVFLLDHKYDSERTNSSSLSTQQRTSSAQPEDLGMTDPKGTRLLSLGREDQRHMAFPKLHNSCGGHTMVLASLEPSRRQLIALLGRAISSKKALLRCRTYRGQTFLASP